MHECKDDRICIEQRREEICSRAVPEQLNQDEMQDVTEPEGPQPDVQQFQLEEVSGD